MSEPRLSHAPVGGRPSLLLVILKWRWPLAIMAVAGAVVVVAWALSRRSGVAGGGGPWKETVLAERFDSYITSLRSTGQGNLEVAILEETATVARSEENRYLWGLLPGGRDVAEIRVPVTYRYQLRLEDPWRLETNGQHCRVWAPAVRPALPPAIHTQGLVRRTDGSWISFRADAVMEALEKSLTMRLTQTAWAKVPLVRDKARETTASFVRHWVLSQSGNGLDDLIVQVEFADEPARLIVPEESNLESNRHP